MSRHGHPLCSTVAAMLFVATQAVGCSMMARDPAFETLSGTISYRQRVALVPESVAVIELLDVSRPDVRPELIAEQRLERPGQVPIKFELRFDRRAIQSGHKYAIAAMIYDQQRVVFHTESPIPTTVSENPAKLEVILDQAPASP